MPDFKKLSEERYTQYAEGYVTSQTHAKGADLERLIAIAQPQSDWAVLDVATGGGHTALRFAPHVAHVTASDLTARMLEKAEAFIRAQGVTNIREYFRQYPQALDDCIKLLVINEVNDAALKIFGARDKQELTDHFPEILGDAGRDSFINELESLCAGRTTLEAQAIHYRLDGTPITVLLRLPLRRDMKTA